MRTFYILSTIVFTLCLQLACSDSSQVETSIPPASSVPVSEIISRSESLFKERADVAKLRESVKVLAQGRDANNRNYEVEWKFAKFSYFLGKALTDEKESSAAFEKGKEAGQIASRIEANKPDGHFWYAANLGELARRSPITVGIKSVSEIQAAMNKVIEIEPGYQAASAYVALAQIELKTTMTGGKAEKAAELLEKAFAIEKNNTNIRLQLAEAYLAMDKDAEARKQIDELLKMKPHPDYVPEYNEDVAKAKKLLETRF